MSVLVWGFLREPDIHFDLGLGTGTGLDMSEVHNLCNFLKSVFKHVFEIDKFLCISSLQFEVNEMS